VVVSSPTPLVLNVTPQAIGTIMAAANMAMAAVDLKKTTAEKPSIWCEDGVVDPLKSLQGVKGDRSSLRVVSRRTQAPGVGTVSASLNPEAVATALEAGSEDLPEEAQGEDGPAPVAKAAEDEAAFHEVVVQNATGLPCDLWAEYSIGKAGTSVARGSGPHTIETLTSDKPKCSLAGQDVTYFDIVPEGVEAPRDSVLREFVSLRLHGAIVSNVHVQGATQSTQQNSQQSTEGQEAVLLNVRVDVPSQYFLGLSLAGKPVYLVVEVLMVERQRHIILRGLYSVRNSTCHRMRVGSAETVVEPGGVYYLPLEQSTPESNVSLSMLAVDRLCLTHEYSEEVHLSSPSKEVILVLKGTDDATYPPSLDFSGPESAFFTRLSYSLCALEAATATESPGPADSSPSVCLCDLTLSPAYAIRNDFPNSLSCSFRSAAPAKEERTPEILIAPTDTFYIYHVDPQADLICTALSVEHFKLGAAVNLAERLDKLPSAMNESPTAKLLRREAQNQSLLYKFPTGISLSHASEPERVLRVGFVRELNWEETKHLENPFTHLLCFYPLALLRNDMAPAALADQRSDFVCVAKPTSGKQAWESSCRGGQTTLLNVSSEDASVKLRVSYPVGGTLVSTGYGEKLELKLAKLSAGIHLRVVKAGRPGEGSAGSPGGGTASSPARDSAAPAVSSGASVHLGVRVDLAQNGLTKILTVLPGYLARNHTNHDLVAFCGGLRGQQADSPSFSATLLPASEDAQALPLTPLKAYLGRESDRMMFLRLQRATGLPLASKNVTCGFCFSANGEHYVKLPLGGSGAQGASGRPAYAILLIRVQEVSPFYVVDIYDLPEGAKPKYMVTNSLTEEILVRQVLNPAGSKHRPTIAPDAVATNSFARKGANPKGSQSPQATHLYLDDVSVPPVVEITVPALSKTESIRVNLNRVGRRKAKRLGGRVVFIDVDTLTGTRNLRISYRHRKAGRVLSTLFRLDDSMDNVVNVELTLPGVVVSVFSTLGVHNVSAAEVAAMTSGHASGQAQGREDGIPASLEEKVQARRAERAKRKAGQSGQGGTRSSRDSRAARGTRSQTNRGREGTQSLGSALTNVMQVSRRPVELFAVSITGISLQFMALETSIMLAVDMERIQVDNFGPDAQFPVALQWKPKIVLDGDEAVETACFHLSLEKLNTPHALNLPMVGAYFGQLVVKADQNLYSNAMSLVAEIMAELKPSSGGVSYYDDEHLHLIELYYQVVGRALGGAAGAVAGALRDYDEDQAPLPGGATPAEVRTRITRKYILPEEHQLGDADKSPTVGMVYLGFMHIDPLDISVSISIQELVATKGVLFSLINSFGSTLTNLENAHLTFEELDRVRLFCTTRELVKNLTSAYVKQATANVAKILGSSSLLGNPFAAIDHIGEGVSDIVAANDSRNRMIGLKNLAGHSIAGLTGIVSSALGTVGTTVSALTLDRQYQRDRSRLLRESEQNMGKAMGNAFVGVGLGIWGGLSGLVLQPMRGSQEDGARGGFVGFAKGLLGLITKPVSGLLDLPIHMSLGAKGKASRSVGKKEDQRHHQRRIYGEEVKPYDWEREERLAAQAAKAEEAKKAAGKKGSKTGSKADTKAGAK